MSCFDTRNDIIQALEGGDETLDVSGQFKSEEISLLFAISRVHSLYSGDDGSCHRIDRIQKREERECTTNTTT